MKFLDILGFKNTYKKSAKQDYSMHFVERENDGRKL